jgi:two-component system, NtrC family, nitrogen regulation sensor histidine kinase NtrY
MADSAPQSLPSGSSTDRWPAAWVAGSMVAVVALAFWQQEPGWLRLSVAAAGTISAAWFLSQVRRLRPVAVLAVAALCVGSLLGAADTATLESIRRDWGAWSAAEREARARRVAESVNDVALSLRSTVQLAAADSALVARALGGEPVGISPPLSPEIESSLLVFRRGELVARAGQMHTPVTPGGSPGVYIADGPFHTSLVARARSADGAIEVVSTALITSAPPADRFTRTLLQTLPGNIDLAHTRVESPDSAHVAPNESVVLVTDDTRRLARVHATTYTEGETRLALQQRARARTSVALLVAVLAFLAVAWQRPARTVERLAAAAAVLLAVAIAPLSGLSNVSTLFDPRSYFAPMGGPLTSTVMALLLTAALALAVLLFALRATLQRPSRPVAIALVLLTAAGGPFLLRDLSRGITLPPTGAGFTLWIAWQLALALVGVTVLLAAASAGQTALGKRRGFPPAVPVLTALLSGVLAPMLWDAPGSWPVWYPIPWVAAIACLALTRRGLSQVVAAAVVAGAGAATLTWGATVRARTDLAQHDIQRIGESDLDAQRLLERFAISLRDEVRPVQTSEVLLRRYASSELARAGYAARLARWSPASIDQPVSVLELAPVLDTIDAQAYVAMMARENGAVEFREARDGLRRILLAAVPAPDGTVTTIALPPRTSLLPIDPFSSFIGVTGERGREAPYRLSLSAAMPGDRAAPTLTWRRRGNDLHGDGVAGDGQDVNRVHAEVDIGALDLLLPRGALLVMLDVLVVMLIWSVTAVADGALGRLVAVRRARWRRSYRVQLSGALLGFFIAPAAIFALWAWYRLQDDDRATRELLVRETLRVAAAEQETRALGAAPSSTGAPLFIYRNGVLGQASDPLLDALAPLGRLLPVSLTADEMGSDDVFTTRRLTTGTTRALVGFRLLTRGASLETPGESVSVLATPARGSEFALDDRREDLGILVLFATMLGALAAIWSSGIAARSLARPVGALREAALDIAAGRAAPTLGTAPATEFAPVYRAFSRMADDLQTSRAALQAAQRRTEAVLQNVASGVLALLRNGDIILANPRAGALLGDAVRSPGATLSQLSPALKPIAEQCSRFLNGSDDEEAFELSVNGRQLQARLTRLPTGAVLTVDDITDLATAQRVLAWGEMARQVAHEIKNPLTPIRLGVQHLRRAYRDGRGDFGEILDRNVGRVLEEIDHLDEIARAFSRYGTAPSERAPAVPVDVTAVVHDVVALEKLGDNAEHGQRVEWQVALPELTPLVALAQRDELREVLINVLENARLAGATSVTVQATATEGMVQLDVVDNGAGITPEVLPHVFEPHFSTRTSGSGLGLAISRRLIEGWGGTIAVTSGIGQGTTVHIGLVRTARDPLAASEPVRR